MSKLGNYLHYGHDWDFGTTITEFTGTFYSYCSSSDGAKSTFLFRVKSHGIREVVWLFTGTMRTVKKKTMNITWLAFEFWF